ncbi:DUF2510 domain-containing protein [Aestuariimicrobium ganziense]|uniref:DUF2510 domain-containing protein n=1 Tax=Aestuariimicrobium ganziense TaxID=2773677 RepID=UPI001944D8DA|nr:DUF2510 domain-containing protein [Aestuariimicrobium ganziense]
MSQPGWYPDPAGQPGHFRYWDGQGWSQESTPNPSMGAPTGAPGGPSSPYGTPQRGGLGRTLGIVAVIAVVALVAWLAIRAIGGTDTVGEDTNTSTPTVSAWDETSSPSATPSSPDPSGSGAQVNCPDPGTAHSPRGAVNGRISGGGLSFAEIPGWEVTGGWGLDWADDRHGQRTTVTPGWAAIAVVGEVPQQRHADTKTAARQLMSCMASSDYYPTLTKRVDKALEEVTVDGAKGWRITSELYVSGRDVKGDIAVVVVLDIGDADTFSVYASNSTIEHEPSIKAVTEAMNSLKVER